MQEPTAHASGEAAVSNSKVDAGASGDPQVGSVRCETHSLSLRDHPALEGIDDPPPCAKGASQRMLQLTVNLTSL